MNKLRKYIILNTILTLLLPIGATAQTILIDGVNTTSISGGKCGEPHTLECQMLTNSITQENYCMWQRSDDGGQTWTNMPQSGKDAFLITVTNDDGAKQLYHVIVANSLETALGLDNGPIAQSNDVSLECDLPICGANENRQVVWKEDFKSTPRGERRECADVRTRKFAGQYNLEYATNINDNRYAIVSHSEDGSTPQYNWFSGGTDHTGNKDGGFLLINNPDGLGNEHALIFEKTIDFDLCPDTWYYFSMYAMCVTGGFARNPNASGAYPNFMFEIIGEDGTTVLESGLSGEVPVAAYGISTWINYGISFNAGNNKNVILRIYDDAEKGVAGDDMAIDDISLIACEKVVPETNLSAGITPDVDGVCGETVTLSLSDMTEWESIYPDCYVIWQKSEDGGFTWETVTSLCGPKVYSADLVLEKSTVGIRYRAIIAKDGPSANFIAANGHSDDACSIYKITNVSTLTCHCETPEISLTTTDTSYCRIKDDSITLSVSVTNGVNVDEYHWMYKTDSDAGWTPITNEGEASLKVSPTEITHYAVYAVNDECLSDTEFCMVRVKLPETISIPLEGKDSICENSSTTLSLNISASREVSWMEKKANEPSFSTISKGGPSLEVSPDLGYSYYAFVEADQQTCKAIISDTMTIIYIESPIAINSGNKGQTVCAGTHIELSASATSSSVIGFRWSKRTDEGLFIVAESAKAEDTIKTDSEYIITYITKICPSAKDSAKYKTVKVDSLSLKASAEVICENGEVTLTADYGTMTDVKWEQMTLEASAFTTISTDLTPKMDVRPAHMTTYRISSSAGGICPTKHSNPITIIVEDSIHLKTEPASATITQGEPLHLTAYVSGEANNFMWQKKVGDNVETLSDMYEIDDTPDTDCEYIATAKGNGCPDVSQTIHVTVEHISELTLSTNIDTVCSGEPVELTATLDNATNVVLYAKDLDSPDFEAVGQALTSNKITVNPYKNTEYRLREEGKDNYSNIVTIYAEQPALVKLTGPDMVCPGSELRMEYNASTNFNLNNVSIVESNADSAEEHPLLWDSNEEGAFELGGSITFSPTQETEYTLVVNMLHCPEKKTTHMVKVPNIPQDYSLTVSKDTLCEDEPVTISTDFPFSEGNLTLSYWRTDIQSQTETIIMTSNSETLIPTGSTQFLLTPHIQEGCPIEERSVSIKVYEDVKATTNDTSICEGQSASLRVNAEKTDYSFIWSTNSDFSDTIGLSDIVNITPDKDVTYYAKVINGKCEKNLEQTIHVVSTPELELTGKDMVCPNGEVTLHYQISSLQELTEISISESEAGSVTGEKKIWDNTMSSSGNGLSGDITYSPQQETEYTLTAINGLCPDKTTTHKIKVAEVPTDYTLTASTDSICSGESVTLTTDFPFSQDNLHLSAWHPEDTDSPSERITMDSRTEIVYPSEVIRYVLTPTTEDGCEAEERSVTIYAFTPVEATTKDTTICEGQSAFLRIYGSDSGQTFTWSQTADFSGTIGTGDMVSVTPTQDATYYVKAGLGKCEKILEQTIHISTIPEIELTGEDIVCPGSALTLKYSVSSTADISNVILRKSVDGNSFSDSILWNDGMTRVDKIADEISYYLNQGTEYTLSVEPLYCPKQETSHKVEIAQTPSDYTLTISADSICLGDPVTITTDFPFSPDKLILSTWTPEETDFASESKSMESDSETVYPSSDGETRYVLTPYTEEGCPGEEQSVSVITFKPIEEMTKDTIICDGEPAILQVFAAEAGHSYTWSHSADITDTIGNGNRIQITPTEDATYYVKAVNGKCEKTMEQTIHIASIPTIELEKDIHSVTCTAIGGFGEYLYDFGKGFSTENILEHTMPSVRYTVKAKDERGCVGDTTFEMEYAELIIPEFFTPQGDGVNDKWEIVNLDKYEHVNVSIFDRFGKKVYESEDADESWDGTYNGYALPSADYWYLINIMDIKKYFKGHFTLIKSK